MPQLDDRYQQDPSMVSRDIAGEAVLVPIRQNTGDLESIYALNETASFAWNLLDGQHTLAEILAAMIAEFEVQPDEAQQDLLELISQLESIQVVLQVE